MSNTLRPARNKINDKSKGNNFYLLHQFYRWEQTQISDCMGFLAVLIIRQFVTGVVDGWQAIHEAEEEMGNNNIENLTSALDRFASNLMQFSSLQLVLTLPL